MELRTNYYNEHVNALLAVSMLDINNLIIQFETSDSKMQ